MAIEEDRAQGGARNARITVAIPTVRPTTLRYTIESVLRQTYPDFVLLVVGQGPDAGLERAVRECARGDRRVRYVHLDRMSVSFARNVALERVETPLIAFTDDDCEVDREWLAHIVRFFDEDPDLGVVAGPLLAPRPSRRGFAVCHGIETTDVLYDPTVTPRQAPEGFDFAGANVAFRVAVARRIGPFDECMGPGGDFDSAEDLDYKFRLESAGVRMRVSREVIVSHTHGARYGLYAVFKYRRSYAIGQGALAAKLTLQGDERGARWLEQVWNEVFQHVRRGRVHRVPNGLVRYFYVKKTYRDCLRTHALDESSGLFKKIGG